MLRSFVLPVGIGCLLGLLMLGFSAVFFCAEAMPPYPGDDTNMAAPKTAAALDLYSEMQSSFAARGIDQPGGGRAAGAKLSGDFKILAICVDFPGKPGSTPTLRFDTLIFGDAPGTVRDYYREVTYHTLTITTINLPSALGWHHLDSNYASYVGNAYGMGAYPHNTQKLCEELVDCVDPYVNFADYDNDGDQFVDGLIIVHAGRGAEFSFATTDIWSHKWGIFPRLKDGVFISAYTIQPEFWNKPGDITIGVFAHEIGHLLGLPDLYDLDQSSHGVGKWSLMAVGAWNGVLGTSPAHMDAWCKSRIGVVTPQEVIGNMWGVMIPEIETNRTAFRLPIEGTAGYQYFLVENRQKIGYDSCLPGSGLLIWRIDETRSSNTQEWYPGHTASGNYMVALEQSDGLWQMEKNLNYGDSTDPYPGPANSASFTATTLPSSNAYSGAPSYVTVTNISQSGPAMTGDFQVSLLTDVAEDSPDKNVRYTPELTNTPNPFNPSTVIRFTSAGIDPVTVSIYDILGRLVNTLYTGQATTGIHELIWNGDTGSGTPLASGVYLARLSTGKQKITRKMMLIR